ncbi:MAG: TldD/PmbA family protein [Gemmatimonadetes bacterium]|nr:TldD/PmbA family protein [Gemmatimonadota bacterium]
MIDALLDAVRRRAQAADALWHRHERTGIAFESGRLKTAGVSEETGVNLRVVQGGRVGVAGTTAFAGPDDLITRALAAAELGEAVDLAFPSHTPLPHVPTAFERVATITLDELTRRGRALVERLERDGCQVSVGLERSVAEVALGNTAGARGAYRSTAITVGADVTRVAGDDVLMVYDYYDAADLASETDLDAIARSINTRLDLALQVVEPPEGSLPVIFTPSGLSAILLPLEQALSGKAVLQGISPLAGKIGERVFDPALSLIDDPLVPGRTESRPIDDEGVPSQRLPLVEGGVVRHFIYDLETAARAQTRSTGHGHRGTFGKPRVGYTNLIIGEFGKRDTRKDFLTVAENGIGGGLIAGIKDGLLIDDLIGVGQGNVIGGAFSHPVALAYRVRDGAIVGRVKDAAVAGNVYELLKRIGGVGNDGRWLGSRWSPSVLLEGVSVVRARSSRSDSARQAAPSASL